MYKYVGIMHGGDALTGVRQSVAESVLQYQGEI